MLRYAQLKWHTVPPQQSEHQLDALTAQKLMGSSIIQNLLLWYVFLSQQMTQPAYFMSKLGGIYTHFYHGHVFERVLLSTGEQHAFIRLLQQTFFLVQFLIWWRTSFMHSTRLLCSSSSSLDAVRASLFPSLCSSHNREHEVSEGLHSLVFSLWKSQLACVQHFFCSFCAYSVLSLIVCLSEEAVFNARWGVFSFNF